MKQHFIGKGGLLAIIFLLGLILPSFILAQVTDVAILIHLRGVYETKISIIPLSGTKQFKSITEIPGIKNAESTTLHIEKQYLPGEFVIRFDYKEKKESTPYPSEKRVFINDQDLELWVSPMFCNNPDSTWFQKTERENTAFALFSKENSKHKEKLGLLQQFLVNYDDTKSKFYRQGIKEYEKRRQSFNQWLDERINQDKTLFVSSTYGFSYVPGIPWEGNENQRIENIITHYLDGIDFTNPNITRTTQLNEFMNTYVNLNAQKAVTVALRDSLIPAAAHTAIEKAKKGNPIVYGWMVDYFYRGFESNNITAGMKVLEPYLNDPDCLTSKRMEIERRLKGMETLVVRGKAPDIALKDTNGNLFDLNKFEPSEKYILLLFWSADCSHCTETVESLYPWQNQPEIRQDISIIAISLDETETEVKSWSQKIKSLSGWKHLRAPEGVRSKVASDYFVLATPVMILLDSRTKEIISLPSSFTQLKTGFPE